MIRSPHTANNWMQVQQQTQKPTNFIQGGGGGGGAPGPLSQMGQQAAMKLASKGIDAGTAKLTGALAAKGGTLGSIGTALGGVAPAAGAGGAGLMAAAAPIVAPLAAGAALGKVFGLFNEGGQVPPQLMQLMESAPPEVKQAIQAFMAGQIGIEELAQVLQQAGVPPEMVQQLMGMIQQAAQPQQQAPEPQALNSGGFAKDPSGNTLPSGMVWDRDLGKAITFGEKSRRLQVQHAQRAAQRRNTVGTEGYSTNAKNYERMRANPGLAPVKVGGMNVGGMVGHRDDNGEWVSGPSAQAGDTWSPDTFINGKIASVHYPTPGPAQNAPVGPLTGRYNMGGTVSMSSPGYYTSNEYNDGGRVPLSSTQPHGPMHLNDGGGIEVDVAMQQTPVKAIKRKTKRGHNEDAIEMQFDTSSAPLSDMALQGLGLV